MKSRLLKGFLVLTVVAALCIPTVQVYGEEGGFAADRASRGKWSRYANNPVMKNGTWGLWDQQDIATHCVLRDDNDYKMYYGNPSGYGQIGLATSPDGINWTKYPGNPIVTNGTTGSWDAGNVGGAWVIKDGGIYKMWYHSSRAIGYAQSSDGINWTKYAGNPVLLNGSSSSSWDYSGPQWPCVLNDSGEYKMWYSAFDGSWGDIGFANSSDGINWAKCTTNPVMEHSGGSNWDHQHAYTPCVVNDSGVYRMWYTGYYSWNTSIGSAHSHDGLNWQRSCTNPELPKSGNGWEAGNTKCPAVIIENNTYKVWYSGMCYYFQIGYATGWITRPYPPVPVSPPNDTWISNTTPTFNWTYSDPDPVDSQRFYTFQIANDMNFNSMLFNGTMSPVESNSFKYYSPFADGIYYWRVQVQDGDYIQSNWSQTRILKIDTTPPGNPSQISSSTHQARAWSNRSVVNVTWGVLPDGAAVSGYDAFSYIWDTNSTSVADTVPEANATARNASSPVLSDGNSHYFHIRARDGAGQWANGSSMIGPFWIDGTPPANPSELASSSHERQVWSTDDTVDVWWARKSSDTSGYKGYSFVWDGNATTVPDETVDSTYTENFTTSPALPDGANWYFHLKVVDNAGNWAPGAIHLGPFRIENSLPVLDSIELNDGEQFSRDANFTVGLYPNSSTAVSGLGGMMLSFNVTEWDDWKAFTNRTSRYYPGPDGEVTLYARIKSNSGILSELAKDSIFLDRVPPEVRIELAAGAGCSGSRTVPFTLSGKDPAPGSGLGEMSLSEDGQSWTDWRPYAGTGNYTFQDGDGNRTLVVRVKDRAGNLAGQSSDSIFIDREPPVISEIRVENLTSRTATIRWLTDGPSAGGIEYGVSSSYAYNQTGTVSSSVHGLTLKALSPNTIYHFRIFARDATGRAPVYSDDMQFTTPGAVDTQKPVINIACVIGTGPTNVTILVELDEPARVVLKYGTAASYDKRIESGELKTRHVIEIPGLRPQTQYLYQAGATDASGNGPNWSKESDFFTDVSDTPPNPPNPPGPESQLGTPVMLGAAVAVIAGVGAGAILVLRSRRKPPGN